MANITNLRGLEIFGSNLHEAIKLIVKDVNLCNLTTKGVKLRHSDGNLGDCPNQTILYVSDGTDGNAAGTPVVRDENGTTTAVGAGGGGGATNLGFIPAPAQGTVTSDTGTDAIIPVATAVNAGLLDPTGVGAIQEVITNGVITSITMVGNSLLFTFTTGTTLIAASDIVNAATFPIADSDALSGVAIGDIYELSTTNIYGMPQGILKRRVV